MQQADHGAWRFSIDDEAAFSAHLEREPRTVVVFRGRQCPHSAKFEPAFQEAGKADEAWSFVIRECRSGGKGEVGDRYDIDITPTVVAFRDGKEWRRLEAKDGVGLPAHRFQEWLDGLDDA